MNLYMVIWNEKTERKTNREYNFIFQAASKQDAKIMAETKRTPAAVDFTLYVIGEEVK